MCCACGGGTETAVCLDSEGDARDNAGDACSWYGINQRSCGIFDDDDFKANEQCCACGGGVVKDNIQFHTYGDMFNHYAGFYYRWALFSAIILLLTFSVAILVVVVCHFVKKRLNNQREEERPSIDMADSP